MGNVMWDFPDPPVTGNQHTKHLVASRYCEEICGGAALAELLFSLYDVINSYSRARSCLFGPSINMRRIEEAERFALLLCARPGSCSSLTS